MTVVQREISAAEKSVPPQFGLINLLKSGAAQLIVLHHLAFYGPMSDHARILWPELFEFLSGNARIAVQIFLVISGFLVAKSLAPSGHAGAIEPLSAIWRRYAKLAPPFFVATLFAAGASYVAARWMDHHSISAPATVSQLSAHALLLHSILGYPSLAAGAWYVAIDFQLYSLVVLVLWLVSRVTGARRMAWLLPVLMALGVTLSLLHFNLDADWDNWAPYFFGSYGLGLLAWWGGDQRRKPLAVALLVLMAVLPALVALMVDFRSRIALALLVAVLLLLCGRIKVPARGRFWTAIHGMGKISYAVFLIHFPVCLLVNAVFTRLAPAEPLPQALGMLLAWGLSLVAGALFHRWVEVPLGRLMQAMTAPLAARSVTA